MKRLALWIAARVVIFTLVIVAATIMALLSAMLVYLVGTQVFDGPEALWRATAYYLPAPAVVVTACSFAIFEFLVHPFCRTPPERGVLVLVGAGPPAAVMTFWFLVDGGLARVARPDVAVTLLVCVMIATILLMVRVRLEDQLFS